MEPPRYLPARRITPVAVAVGLALSATLGAHATHAQTRPATTTTTPSDDRDAIVIEGSAGATSGPAAPGSDTDDTRAREGELVFVVHELPLTARPAGQQEPPPDPRWPTPERARPQPLLPTPEPDGPAQHERAYAPGLVFGANVSAGGPSGVLGAFVEVAPVRPLSLRVGAGVGLNFGPSVEVGALLRPLRFGRWAPLVSLTFSTNWTSNEYRALPGLDAAANSNWFTPALGVELRLAPIILLRISLGASVMLNTGEFSNVAFNRWWGPDRPPSTIGFSPVSAADAHDEGRALVVPAVWFDFGVLGPRW